MSRGDAPHSGALVWNIINYKKNSFGNFLKHFSKYSRKKFNLKNKPYINLYGACLVCLRNNDENTIR